MTERRANALFWLGLTVGVLAMLIVRRKTAAQKTHGPPHLKEERALQHKLVEKYGAAKTTELLARVRTRYADLYDTRHRHENRALRDHLDINILQGLAIYQVLGEENDDQVAVLAEIDDLFVVYAEKPRRLMAILGRMPGVFTLLGKLTPRVLAQSFPPGGWTVEWVENNEHRVAFNMTSCFYLDALREYGAPELTAAFCKLDDLIYEGMSPTITWARTQTMGRGDEVCNFCWNKRNGALTFIK